MKKIIVYFALLASVIPAIVMTAVYIIANMMLVIMFHILSRLALWAGEYELEKKICQIIEML